MKLLHTIHYAAPPKRYWSEDANEPSFFFVYVSKCNRRRHLLDAPAVEGESSECLICTKYSIIIEITIVVSLGQICYRILQTRHACTHALVHTRTGTRVRTHARTRTCTHTAVAAVRVRRTGYRYLVSPNRDGPLRLRQCRSLAIQITTRTGDPICPILWMFFAYKNIAMPN